MPHTFTDIVNSLQSLQSARDGLAEHINAHTDAPDVVIERDVHEIQWLDRSIAGTEAEARRVAVSEGRCPCCGRIGEPVIPLPAVM